MKQDLSFYVSFIVNVFLARDYLKNIVCENPANVPHEECEEAYNAVNDNVF